MQLPAIFAAASSWQADSGRRWGRRLSGDDLSHPIGAAQSR
jgi:hypothetical protein